MLQNYKINLNSQYSVRFIRFACKEFSIISYLCTVEWNIVHIDETTSTNQWLKEHGEGDMVVVADYQTAGRGCGTNTWESERGKNLLFSVLLHPVEIPAREQFRISMAVSVALCEMLSQYAGDFSIKWPNDIYWRDCKICGMLIENRVSGQLLAESIVGIGLNVNQRKFHSDAPNPVSLCQIVGREMDCDSLLTDFLRRLEAVSRYELLRSDYESKLFRRERLTEYADKTGVFQASLKGVKPDGRLLLRDGEGCDRLYAFKEVQFII